MKPVRDDLSPVGLFLYRSLLALVGLAVTTIVLVTIVALATGKPGKRTETAAAAPESPAVFTQMGRLRIASASDPPAAIIVSVAFPYDRDDRAFYEELVAKNQDFCAITSGFFGSFTTAELLRSDAEELKRQLRELLNAELRLGKIDVLYFIEYLVIQ